MRRVSLLALSILFAACSSSQSSGAKAKIPAPAFDIEQVSGPAEAAYPYGGFEVQYRFEITNNADVPLTLKRVTVRTVNPEGGAYSLTPPFDYYFNDTIAAGTTRGVERWIKAYGYGRGPRDSEPVTVRGVAYFESPAGYVNQVFVRELDQMR